MFSQITKHLGGIASPVFGQQNAVLRRVSSLLLTGPRKNTVWAGGPIKLRDKIQNTAHRVQNTEYYMQNKEYNMNTNMKKYTQYFQLQFIESQSSFIKSWHFHSAPQFIFSGATLQQQSILVSILEIANSFDGIIGKGNLHSRVLTVFFKTVIAQ